MPLRVLIVDDDPGLRLALTKALARKGVEVIDVATGEAAIELLKTGASPAGPVDVCVLDLRMPGMNGLEVLRRTANRKVPVVVLTGHGTVPDAVEAMRLGAANFVQKPVDADELLPVLEQARRDERGDTMLGASDVMLAFLEKVDRAAQSDEPVLLVGEEGTGKELSARRIHAMSARKKAPLLALAGAELREPFLQRAGDGTLFVDEVGDVPADVQPKLLRVRARILAATSRDLKALVDAGAFRADLLLRLSVVPLHVPPLRDRGDDIVLIARAALGRASERPLALTPAAEERLLRYRFPGNVRELNNLMKRAALFATDAAVDVGLVDELLAESPFATADGGAANDGPRAGQRVTLEELEKTHIRRLLDELKNVSEVARIVGIDRRTLQRKMAAWGFRDA